MHDRDYQAPFKKDADVLYYISPGNTDDTVIFEPKKQLMENAQALDDQAYYNLIFGPADYKSGYKGGFLIRKPYQSFFQEFAPLQSRIIQFLNALMLAFKSDINAMQAFLTLLYEDLKDNTHIYYDQKNDTYASSSFSKEFLILAKSSILLTDSIFSLRFSNSCS